MEELLEWNKDNKELQRENARLQEFALRLANRIYLAHEVLAHLAEKQQANHCDSSCICYNAANQDK